MKTSLSCVVLMAAIGVVGCDATRQPRRDFVTLPHSRSARTPPPLAPPPLASAVGDAPAADPAWRIEGQAPTSSPSFTSSSMVRNFRIAFDQAPVSAVADAVLGQSMRRSFRVDPAVQGSLTLRLTGRMTEAEALSGFDRALRSVDAALVPEGRGYAVVPAAQSHRLTAPPVLLDNGQEVVGGAVVYQARSIGAAEIARLLEPLAGEGAKVRADPAREQVVIAGDPTTVGALVRTARSLDVDWLQGKSLQFFPARHASPGDLAAEINQVFGGPDGPMGSHIQFIEMPRLNGLLVIARSPGGLDRAAEWIARFDRPPPPASRRLRSIPLSNLEAAQFVTTLAALLDTGGTAKVDADAVTGAPATPMSGGTSAPDETVRPGASGPVATPTAGGASGLRLTADPRSNALILLADDAEYRNVLDIVSELDAPPPQVLIEATIAEVTLNDRLRFGVQWFFDEDELTGGFGSGSDDSAPSSFPGFSLRYLTTDVRAVLNALSSITDVQLISTPRILVLSNDSAKLQVGDQVPIITQSAVGLNADSRILNSVQYRDTGVVLSVTPRVSQSGRMFIEIEQEVSEVAGTTTSDIDSPTIQQRRISTRVQVEDGQLIVLGGLLRSSRSLGDAGIPYLSRIPGLGAAFRSRDDTQRQTELVMFLRPTVVRASRDIDEITNEMIGRLYAIGLPIETVAQP